jgi:recombination protein RecA
MHIQYPTVLGPNRLNDFPPGAKDGKQQSLFEALQGVHTSGSVTTTGFLSLDLSTGIGGYPSGRIIEVFGDPESGKTTLAIHAAIQYQKQGKLVAIIDGDCALHLNYCHAVGVDMCTLFVTRPNTCEEAMDTATALARSGAVGLIIIDSLTALMPQKERNYRLGEAPLGLQSSVLSRQLRTLTRIIEKSHTTVIITNQTRQQIRRGLPDTRRVPGGISTKFYAAIRLQLERLPTWNPDHEIRGASTAVRILKNRYVRPLAGCTLLLHYGRGFSSAADLVHLGMSHGVIRRQHTEFYLGNVSLGANHSQAVEHIHRQPGLQMAIRDRLLQESNHKS